MTKITLKHDKEFFDFVKKSPASWKKDMQSLYETKKSSYELIINTPKESRTFENTLDAMQRAGGKYMFTSSLLSMLHEVSPKKEIRDVAHSLMNEYSPKFVEIERDEKLYFAVRDYVEGNFKKEKKTLRPEDIKLVNDTYKDMVRSGYALPKDKQKLYSQSLKKLINLTNEFHKNINDYNDYILCTDEDLAGVPERVKSSLMIDEASGKRIVSLKYPEYGPFMAYATSGKKRLELYKKEQKKGGKKNMALLVKMVEERQKMAKILGYATHADYQLEDRMAKNVKNVQTLYDSIVSKVSEKAKQDIKELSKYAKKNLGIDKFDVSDLSYASVARKKAMYDYDPEQVREYFPLPNVLTYMFEMFGNLFGFDVNVSDVALWHKDAIMYEVSDRESKEFIGYFVLDLFPRDNKYGHACMIDTVVPHETALGSSSRVAPLIINICNFPTPKKIGKKTIPSLLSLGEIETLFHEFGHALHGLLSQANLRSQSGTNVSLDFVETPSQFMEFFLWNRETLNNMSKHFESGSKLPDDLVDKILKGKDYMQAYFYMRQITLGMLDMDMHSNKSKDFQKSYKNYFKKHTGMALPEKDVFFPGGWGHMAGYDAGYYSYLWTLVYARDAFSMFEEKGLNNKELGMKWRKCVLEKGSSEDELKLLTEFLGRKPNNKAFVKDLVR